MLLELSDECWGWLTDGLTVLAEDLREGDNHEQAERIAQFRSDLERIGTQTPSGYLEGYTLRTPWGGDRERLVLKVFDKQTK